MAFFLQAVISGLAMGSIYAMVALGYVVIYQATRVLNFAHGQMLMLGAMLGVYFHVDLNLPYGLTFLVVALVAGACGMVSERLAFRPLGQAPAVTVILSTAAVGQIIVGLVRIWRADELRAFPPMFDLGLWFVGPVIINPEYLIVVLFAALFLVGFHAFFKYTTIGKAMRATSQSQEGAAIVGIPVPRVYSQIWAVSSALAAVAGIMIAPLILVTPDMGTLALKAFVAAVLGGFTSIPGSLFGGLILGVTEDLISLYFTTAFRDVIIFGLLILVLMVKPTGLLGRKGSERV